VVEDDIMTRGGQEVVTEASRNARAAGCWFHLSLAAGFWIAVIATAPAALAGPAEDAYVAGYATAVLERQMDVRGSKITVKDGVVTVEVAGLPRSEHEKLAAALSTIGGVVRVEVVEQREPPATAPPATAPLPTTAATPAGPAVEAEVPQRGLELLPKGLLFAPLIADPRWPHFSAVYQRFHEDARLGNAAIASLGETFSLVRGPLGEKGGAWEVGIQAGVFSLFDLDAPSSDLVNTDYIVGFPFAYRARNFSALARFYHQSSHLGDEFLIENRVERVNLSYEAIDLRLSYEVTDWLRLYGGGGYIVRGDPSDLEPWSTQAGFELRSPRAFFGGTLRPLGALDTQYREQNNWHTDLSVRAGVQFEQLAILDRRIQLLLEYFNGYSPNGQFYRDKIEYIGLGLHLYLY
jgi:Protein of unknown function (DUF1207)